MCNGLIENFVSVSVITEMQALVLFLVSGIGASLIKLDVYGNQLRANWSWLMLANRGEFKLNQVSAKGIMLTLTIISFVVTLRVSGDSCGILANKYRWEDTKPPDAPPPSLPPQTHTHTLPPLPPSSNTVCLSDWVDLVDQSKVTSGTQARGESQAADMFASKDIWKINDV